MQRLLHLPFRILGALSSELCFTRNLRGWVCNIPIIRRAHATPLGEAVALVGTAGIDRQAYIEILTSSIFNVPTYKTYGNLIAQGKFEPALFAAPLGHKDIRLALAAAESLRVPMPLASLLHNRFLRLRAQGGDKLDWSAIGGLATQDAGDGPGAPPALTSSTRV